MIPFPKEPEIEVEINDFNPNLYVTMADRVDNRIWSPNTYPWIEGETSTAVVITDSYSESNRDSAFTTTYAGANPFAGQTFTCNENASLVKQTFYLKRTGTPSGTIHARLYASTPSAVLATSVSILASNVPTSAYTLIDFNFPGTFQMVSGTTYTTVFVSNIGDAANRIDVGVQSTGPKHLGHSTISNDGTLWVASLTSDLCFYVYGRITMPTTSIYNIVNYSSPWLIP